MPGRPEPFTLGGMTSEMVGTGRRGGPIVGFLVLVWVYGLIAAAVWWVHRPEAVERQLRRAARRGRGPQTSGEPGPAGRRIGGDRRPGRRRARHVPTAAGPDRGRLPGADRRDRRARRADRCAHHQPGPRTGTGSVDARAAVALRGTQRR